MSTRQLSQKLTSIAETWTRDPFRPNLQLQTFLTSLAAHPRLTPEAVEATRALQNNDMQKKYPLTQKMLRPASAPLHYERLVEGFEKSAQGIGRPWWKVFFGIW
ncbi:hypothetical protein GALMADRAFT_124303 [Galerina marginata CBS 339.88]|uniref:Uncharacterized protein n=1 Tax=Galerina marginata (strain CBS 339.88) TaxID=685588 RepID=A0A067ST19_GALM3|nr:hypothetical protein GALMADRAFT_124303 [Galerina marginata CBS 339.88]